MNYELEFEYNLLAVLLLIWLLLITSCKSTESCTKRERKKATKHWVKGYSQCPDEYAKQSAIAFPYIPSTDTQLVYKEGAHTTDTLYMQDVINDTVYRTKTIVKRKVDTLVKSVVVKERDLRVESQLQAEVSKYKKEAEMSAIGVKNWRLATLILGGILAALGLFLIVKRK